MEYSLIERNRDGKQGIRHDFPTLASMIEWIKKHGEIASWIINVHHM